MESWTNRSADKGVGLCSRASRLGSVPFKIALAASIPLLIAACENPAGLKLEDLHVTVPVEGWAVQAAMLIDAHRASLGCTPLRWHEGAAAVAEAYARQMSDERFFGHVDPAGTTFKQRLSRAGIAGYTTAAETIAAGQDNPPKVVADWLASPDHKTIVEDCRFTRIGLGFHSGTGPYREYWTAVFFSTE